MRIAKKNTTAALLSRWLVLVLIIALVTLPTSRAFSQTRRTSYAATRRTTFSFSLSTQRPIPALASLRASSNDIVNSTTTTLVPKTDASATTEQKETTFLSTSTTAPSPIQDSDILNEEDVVCARGVCVVAEEPVMEEVCAYDEDAQQILCELTDEPAVKPGLNWPFLWPRALLLVCSVLYGTNFPLGRLMNESLPASAATSSRMVLAAVALSPFLLQLKPSLRSTAALCGTFTALGYISQSIALVDTPAATVSFLGALVVIVCPALAVAVDKRPMSFADAPQTWIAAILCLFGVGVLELGGGGGIGDLGWGDAWSVLQAVGFGTSFYITERMMAKEPSQALPITAMQCAMSAAFSGIWAVADGYGFCSPDGALSLFGSPYGAWLADQQANQPFTLPAMFMDDNFRMVALAAAFTGFITTAGNRVGETVALGKLSSSEASVLLATEPLWAAVFASFLISEQLSLWDGVGGAVIVISCVATALDPAWLREKLSIEYEDDKATIIDAPAP